MQQDEEKQSNLETGEPSKPTPVDGQGVFRAGDACARGAVKPLSPQTPPEGGKGA